MDKQQLQQYARYGAQARLAALNAERDDILKMFPELRDGQPATRTNGAEPAARKRRTMSAAERNAVGKRMRAYWAERRAKKAAGAKKSSAKAAKRKSRMSAEARKAQGERMKAYWAAKRAEKAEGNGAGKRGKARRKGGRT